MAFLNIHIGLLSSVAKETDIVQSLCLYILKATHFKMDVMERVYIQEGDALCLL